MKSFESFDHTADVGLRVRGKDLKELFVHAAEGLFDLIAEPRVRPPVGRHRGLPLQIKMSASSQEDLLIAWLRELIYLSSARRMVFWDFEIKQLDVGADPRVRPPAGRPSALPRGRHRGLPLRIHAEIFGEKMDPKKHILKKEVKAVTYHGLSLKKTHTGWVAEVILDV